MPTTPALPNGLRDALKQSETQVGSGSGPKAPGMSQSIKRPLVNEITQVTLLLNPCTCGMGKCLCRPSISLPSMAPEQSGCCAAKKAPAPALSSNTSALDRLASCCTALRDLPPAPTKDLVPPIPGPQIFAAPPSSTFASPYTAQPANFPPIVPRPSTISTGPSCGCGHHCACPDCTIHREGLPGSSTKHHCADGCATCVDHAGGVELPGQAPASTFMDDFLARAAAIPAPPVGPRSRSHGLDIDPTNVIVYPPALFAGSRNAQVRDAFGLVEVPKLECCGGRCSCPANQCSCGQECGGCCADGLARDEQ